MRLCNVTRQNPLPCKYERAWWAGIGWTEANNTRANTTCPPYSYDIPATFFHDIKTSAKPSIVETRYIASLQLSIINYQLSIINYQLSIINYQLSIINYQLIAKSQ